VTTVSTANYQARVAQLVEAFTTIPPNAPVRLGKRTSNLFRIRAPITTPTLHVSDFQHVLQVDPEARIAEVEGMVTYERLVDATLRYGLMPMVVPQLKTITLGGAVAGMGIESSSFRNGMPHESVLEMDVLTGDGRVLVVGPDNEHRELFYGFPNSYGTLGYALRLRIELEPVKPYVRLRHVRHRDPSAFFAELATVCQLGSLDGEPVDFVDGTVFGPDEMYLTAATYSDHAPYTSDYTWMDVYYRSIQRRVDDYLTIRDYLWRWDTDWFWCSRAFGAQRRWVRRLAGRRLLRSDVYWKIAAFERRYGPMRGIDRLRGKPPHEEIVQDVEVPVANATKFLDFFHAEIPISPVWVCPLRQRDASVKWQLYPLQADTLYVNFGFWSSVELSPGETDGSHNRRIERTVEDLDGRKSLYSTSYYDEDEFWRLYNGAVYATLKQQYDPGGRLLDLYAKCVRRR
jgi:FAD/FMN-containing dehydrogenase